MTDLSAQFRAQYERARKRADEAEQRGDVAAAAHAHRNAADLMKQLVETARDVVVKQQRFEKMQAHLQRANQLETGAHHKVAVPVVDQQMANDEDRYETDVMSLVHRSTITWDDIGGLEKTKRDIKTAYGMALARQPQGVKLGRLGWMLFYGPPGTGKTLLAAATSNGLEATFFSVKVSDLLSKYFGESSKLIGALYRVARKHSPAVIFLDEFEAITPQRGQDDSSAERRMVATLLPELDGLTSKDSAAYVLTIAATNLPWLMDKAILSRFEKKIYIPLPDELAREAILQIQLTKRGHQTEVLYPELVRRTEGYSGREIEKLCKEAVNHMTQRANPDLLNQVDKGKAAVKDYQLRVLPLTEVDFDVAFAHIQPETTARDLDQYDQWHKRTEE